MQIAHGKGRYAPLFEASLERRCCLYAVAGQQVFGCQTLACVLINQPDELDIMEILAVRLAVVHDVLHDHINASFCEDGGWHVLVLAPLMLAGLRRGKDPGLL